MLWLENESLNRNRHSFIRKCQLYALSRCLLEILVCWRSNRLRDFIQWNGEMNQMHSITIKMVFIHIHFSPFQFFHKEKQHPWMKKNSPHNVILLFHDLIVHQYHSFVAVVFTREKPKWNNFHIVCVPTRIKHFFETMKIENVPNSLSQTKDEINKVYNFFEMIKMNHFFPSQFTVHRSQIEYCSQCTFLLFINLICLF